MYSVTAYTVALGGQVVIVFAIGLKVRVIKSSRGDGFLSTTFFRGEVKPAVPCF
jgi:hypothetical protein